MARITADGIIPLSLQEWITELETAFQDALGSTVDVSSESVAGQLIGVLGFKLANADAALAAKSRSFNVDLSTGVDLVDLASFAQVTQNRATQSTVTATLTGTDGAEIIAGSRASTTTGNVFYTTAERTVPSSGSIDVDMRSTEFGPITAPANSLTQILDPVSGWTGINNDDAAALGSNVEADETLRTRFRASLGRNSRGLTTAIRSAVLAVDGVTNAIVFRNDTSTPDSQQGISITPNSILVLVEGGTDQDVAEAISTKKGLGVNTSGDVVMTVTGDNPGVIRFMRVVNVPVEVTLATMAQSTFPANGLAALIANINGFFELLDIGEHLPISSLYLPILLVGGHIPSSLTAIRRNGYSLTGTDTISALATIQAITAGTFTFTVNGTVINVTGINFSAIADVAGAATVLENAIQSESGDVATATVTTIGNVTAFVITIPPSSGVANVIGSAGTGTVANALGLSSGDILGGIETQNDVRLNERLTLATDDINITTS